MNFVCFNGKFYPADTPLFTADNRGFKYGDGVFETMKLIQGKIPLLHFHFERLFTSMEMLQLKFPEGLRNTFESQIQELCGKNICTELARVRLAVYRSELGCAYVIEALPLTATVNKWNDEGLAIDVYPHAKKSCDPFANLKSANFLPYTMSALYAKENGVDDAIVLNAENNIADTSKANIFFIKNNKIITPALDQGCVNGVMRRYLIEKLEISGEEVFQNAVNENDLLDAEEIFLTNAIFGMRWVRSFQNRNYTSEKTKEIYSLIGRDFLSPA